MSDRFFRIPLLGLEITYRTYMVGLLFCIYAFNNVDGFALGLVLQYIKRDLHVSDTELGFLTGIAFAAFYAIMGIPIARWADRGNRVTIIGLTTLLWSIMVMLCGVAANFTQLLLIRIGVAVGEAGCIPPANSLIPDYFNRAERPRASGFYLMGGNFGVFIGFVAAGWINQYYGWRATFIALGVPGILFAALAAFTLREPRLHVAVQDGRTKSGHGSVPAAKEPHPSLIEASMTLLSNRTFRNVVLCFSVASFFGFGISQWMPTFFVRSFHLQTGEIGTWMGVMVGFGGMLGIWLGGEIATRWAPNNEPLQLKGMAIIYVVFGFVYAGIFASSSYHLSFALLGISLVAGAMVNGPLFGMIQTLVPVHMRAFSVALIYLGSNLIGRGLGPLAVGALSDVLRPLFGDESLRYALLIFCPGYTFCAWYFWIASKTVARDIAAAHGEPAVVHDIAEAAAKTSLA